ncbi:AbrB/MazE/SpoVT family DNA-binding domain-containing protein [Candidatus Woesearchaeota archaeon]|nr:AbrB/MazE/SpoVT family DNA-binding domain-containing protein [Candidatus Woesearchaeota archaeon]
MNIKFIGKAKLTQQGQLTLPIEARNELKISIDTELYWYQVDNYLIVVKELISEKDLENLLKKHGTRRLKQ